MKNGKREKGRKKNATCQNYPLELSKRWMLLFDAMLCCAVRSLLHCTFYNSNIPHLQCRALKLVHVNTNSTQLISTESQICTHPPIHKKKKTKKKRNERMLIQNDDDTRQYNSTSTSTQFLSTQNGKIAQKSCRLRVQI